MYRIAVIGDKDSVYGFAALGLDVVYVGENDDPTRLLKSSAKAAMVLFTSPKLWRRFWTKRYKRQMITRYPQLYLFRE